jgi:hypothetical protein
MSMKKKTTLAVVTAFALGICSAAYAGADPGTSPCGPFSNPICAFIPLLPELDHDVDLTMDPGVLNGNGATDVHLGTEPNGSQAAQSLPGP